MNDTTADRYANFLTDKELNKRTMDIDLFEATIEYIDEVVKKLTIPVVMQSCDTCKHLSTCRFWQEAPNNGATCKFYIEHIT